MAYTQEAGPLVGTGSIDNPKQGTSISLSADGNTLVVGGPFDDTDPVTGAGIGAAWVFTRSGGTWASGGYKVVGGSYIGTPLQGSSVAISGDGSTLAIGGPIDDTAPSGYTGIGAVWVFTKFGSIWAQDAKLIGAGYVDGPSGVSQGSSISLSDDGNTLAVGGYNDNAGIGATWVFNRSGGVWSQQGSKLVGTGYAVPGSSWQGISVALSANGDTLVVGGPLTNTSTGGTWVFTRSGGVWTQQGSKLVGTGYTPGPFGPGTPNQGDAVAVSADGDTLATSGPQEPGGTAWVFTRSGGVWTQQGSKLLPNDNTGPAVFGYSLSLNSNGDILALGGPYDNEDPGTLYAIGATWIFTRSGGVWSQQGSKLVGTGYSTASSVLQGWSVALSSDDSTLASGAQANDNDIGAFWVFSSGATPTTTTTTTAAPGTTTTTTLPPPPPGTTTTTTSAPTTNQYLLTNIGTEGLTLQSMIFYDPLNIGHTANLINLGGSSAETGNASLSYNFPAGTTQTFTLDYFNIAAGGGTYYGNVIINGSDNTRQVIGSVITVPTRTEPCNTVVEYDGGLTFPSEFLVNLGANTAGTVTFTYNAFTIPDRFVVIHNGVIQIDTGYIGNPGQLGNLNAALPNYPPSYTTAGVTVYNTYPVSSIGPNNFTTGISFNKILGVSTATVLVFGPLPGTYWQCKLTCAALPTTTTTTAAPSGPGQAIFGFGFSSFTGASSTTNLVDNTGVVAADQSALTGTPRTLLAAASYGGDKAIFGFGAVNVGLTVVPVTTTNLVNNLGVVATDVTSAGTARSSLAAAGYGTDKAIFGYGTDLTSDLSTTNLVDNTGVVAANQSALTGSARHDLAAASYGTDKAIFGFGFDSNYVSITNLVSNTGVVVADQSALTGTARSSLAAAGYGGDKAIFGFGFTGVPGYGSSPVSITNLVNNLGVVAADQTALTGTARRYPAAASYGGDKAIFGFGNADPSGVTGSVSITNLVNSLGVVAADQTALTGAARAGLAAASYGT